MNKLLAMACIALCAIGCFPLVLLISQHVMTGMENTHHVSVPEIVLGLIATYFGTRVFEKGIKL